MSSDQLTLRYFWPLFWVTVLMIAAPLVGVWIAGGDPSLFVRFPPRPLEAANGSFTPLIFAIYLIAIVGVLAPFVAQVVKTAWHSPNLRGTPSRSLIAFPLWGWAGLLLLGVSWVVAWVPMPGLEELRRLSFTPLWVGYTVAVSAWVRRRGGRVMLVEEPVRFLALFPASALFWYLFEFLNQFTGNWIYEGTGVGTHEAFEWFLRSALPFSTVLPAVLVTRDWLATWPILSSGLDRFAPIKPQRPQRAAVLALLIGTLGLVTVAIWPDALYSFLWSAPPLLMIALQALNGQRHLFVPVAQGDWRDPWLTVIAALFCGLCWELWNVFSLARWTYHIPHAQVLHLFEMPLLGYAGYLPFGITCAVAAQLLTGMDSQARHWESR